MTSRTPLRLRASHGKIAVTALKMATSRNRVRNTFGTWLVQPSPVRTGGAGCPLDPAVQRFGRACLAARVMFSIPSGR